MASTVKFGIILQGIIIDNLLKIAKDSFKANLDVLYPTEAALPADHVDFLKDLAQKTRGNYIRLTMPALAIEGVRGGADESGDSAFKARKLTLNAYLTVQDSTPYRADVRLDKYMAAFEACLDAPISAYTLNVPTNRVFGLMKGEVSWQYNQIAKSVNEPDPSNANNKITGYLKSVTFTIPLTYNEM
jgi:hypothetical protein